MVIFYSPDRAKNVLSGARYAQFEGIIHIDFPSYRPWSIFLNYIFFGKLFIFKGKETLLVTNEGNSNLSVRISNKFGGKWDIPKKEPSRDWKTRFKESMYFNWINYYFINVKYILNYIRHLCHIVVLCVGINW